MLDGYATIPEEISILESNDKEENCLEIQQKNFILRNEWLVLTR